MKKPVRLLLFIAAGLIFHGCIDLGIHVSGFPLGPPGSPVPGLTGSWEKADQTNDDSGIDNLEVLRFNKKEYVIRSRGGGDASLLRGFITEISGEPFLNIQELTEGKKEFVFCRIRFSGEDEMTLHFIGDTLFKSDPPKNSRKFRKFIIKHLKDPALFNNEMKFSFRRVVK